MKNALRTLLLLGPLAVGSIAPAQSDLLSQVIGTHKLSPIEAAAAIVIGDALGINVESLVQTQRTTNTSFGTLGPAMVISRNTGQSLDYVLQNKPKGEGWGNVAKRLGMHPGAFNQMRAKGGTFENQVWMNMLHSKYQFPESEYSRVKRQGLTDLETVLAVVRSEGRRDSLNRAVKDIVDGKPRASAQKRDMGKAGTSAGVGKGRGRGGSL